MSEPRLAVANGLSDGTVTLVNAAGAELPKAGCDVRFSNGLLSSFFTAIAKGLSKALGGFEKLRTSKGFASVDTDGLPAKGSIESSSDACCLPSKSVKFTNSVFGVLTAKGFSNFHSLGANGSAWRETLRAKGSPTGSFPCSNKPVSGSRAIELGGGMLANGSSFLGFSSWAKISSGDVLVSKGSGPELSFFS